MNLIIIKKLFLKATFLFLSTLTYGQVYFGDGSDGTGSITSNSVVNSYTKIESVSGSNFIIMNTTSFTIVNGDVVLLINMFSGKYELRTVNSMTGMTVNLPAGAVENSTFSTNSQMIKVPQFLNLTITTGQEITCPQWDGETGGVVCFLVQNTLTMNGGEINVEGKGFYGGAGGTGGLGGNGGLGGFSASNYTSYGGQTGYGGSGINGAGWGGGDGFSGTNGVSGTTAYYSPTSETLPCGNTIASCNNSPNPDSRFYMGDGGAGGAGGNGKFGAGGGGSNCSQAGIDGGVGGFGGNGGNGGVGGGIIYIKAGNVVHGSTVIKAMGTAGSAGSAGTQGGNGGAGTCGGGGGDGADGGNGGGGGHGGAGGAVKIIKSGGSIVSSLVNINGGGGAIGGTGGTGGTGGLNSTDITGTCSCLTILPCSFHLIIPFLSNPYTIVTVDEFGQTHFIFVFGDSILDLIYSDLSICNDYYIGLLSGTLFEEGIAINQYFSPIASSTDNILLSLIDFVTNNTPNLDSSQESIQTLNYQLIDGCICPNCSSQDIFLADNGNPGDNGPGGSEGGTGWFDEDNCSAPENINYSLILCPGQCSVVNLINYDSTTEVIVTYSSPGIDAFISGNIVLICNYSGFGGHVIITETNQCGQSNSFFIHVMNAPNYININLSPYIQTICSGSSANIYVNSEGCYFDLWYNMTLPTGVTTDIPIYGNIMPWMPFTPIFYNSTSSVQVVYIYCSNYNGQYNGQSETIQVTVNPNTTPLFTQLGPYCQDATPDVLPTTSNNGIAGTWSPATISTAAVGNSTYTFTPTSTATPTCATSATMTISIAPLPTATISGTTTVCQNAAQPNITFTGSNSTAPYTFTYTINGGATQTITTAGTNSAVTFPVPTNIVGTYTYTITSVAVGSCHSIHDVAAQTVTVNPYLLPTFSLIPDYCNGSSIPALPTTSNNSITGTWSPVINNVATTAAVTAIYTFTPTAGTDICANQATLAITVHPTPTLDAGANQTICSGDYVTLNGSGGSNYQWNYNVVNGQSFAPSESNSYVINGSDSLGCTGTDTVEVTVLENSASTITQAAFDSYTLNGQTYTQSGTYMQTVPAANGCDSLITLNLTLDFTGLYETGMDLVSISPNPTTGTVNIKVDEKIIGTAFHMYNNQGKVVLTGKIISENTIIELSNLSAGIYLFSVGENMKQTFKVIKE